MIFNLGDSGGENVFRVVVSEVGRRGLVFYRRDVYVLGFCCLLRGIYLVM